MTAQPFAMSQPTPTPGAPETQAVRAMFDRIAPRYDLLNRLLSAGTDQRWRRAAVGFLGAPPRAHVLDLCTGTADLLIAALAGAPQRRGTGVDLSFEMLRRASGKLAREGLAARAALLAGDALRLPLRGSVFDGALIAFGIRNVSAPEAALVEIRRVLKPGGRLVVLEFAEPPGPLGGLFRLYFRHLLPRIGAWISGDASAYRYLPASVERFPSPAAFKSLMESAGFVGVEQRPLTAGIAYLYRGDKPA
jgi:demethylmenaquinone methyltransferase/2-methoxy-6-polyprenyl-1,4-benzoquinol methylase